MAKDEKNQIKKLGRKGQREDQLKDISVPPYLTVDELHYYRRRRQSDWLRQRDNLKIEEGSFKLLKSEYKRRFKSFFETLKSFNNGKEKNIFYVKPAEEFPKLEVSNLESEYNESFSRRAEDRLKKPSSEIIDEGQMDNVVPRRVKSRHFCRRPTNLKIEGDFCHVTEHAEKFIEYLLQKRAELLRTPTTLKLEGDMEKKTETTDKFVKYDTVGRPPLCKKFSQLHLQGEMLISTEKREKFLPFEPQKRPPLIKKSTNLHLEGDLTLLPEYRREFVPYVNTVRAKPSFPVNHLKIGGSFENVPENDKIFDATFHPFIPRLREPSQSPKRPSRSRKPSSSSRRPSPSSRRHSPLSRRPSPSSRRPSSPSRGFSPSSRRPSSSSRGLSPSSRGPSPPSMRPPPSPRRQTEPVQEAVNNDFPRVLSQPNIMLIKASDSDLSKSGLSVRSIETRRKRYDSETTEAQVHGSYKKFPETRHHSLKNKKELLYDAATSEVYQSGFVPYRSESESTLQGRFECQPEYRRAYKDYIIKEKRPPLVPRRRALEGVDPDLNLITSVNEEELLKGSSSSLNVPQGSKSRSRSPSPTSRGSLIRTPSPKLVPSRPSSRSVPKMNEGWDESEDNDPAFVVLKDRVKSRRSIRHDLYKEQKWMPSWSYSID